MHIKEIIIDGFKSYAVKTSIQGFDRHFNAITGLNGSGKSNIFDAICFLMGISSLTHVRASNLQDLVYNKGNTGINKASVTIIFDNKDKANSPIGCDDYDEIIISRTIYQGKSKYYLNGYTVTQENIKSLFQSVQLNINNPHFLILQGKIRQVVNMKPIEILGLLEEAAGTSIYEMKKDSSLKLIKKKENKLEEITKILVEEISPQLEKLMKDKQNYLTWKSRENEINRILKILTANDYYVNSKGVASKQSELVQYKSQEEELQKEVNSILVEVSAYEEKIKKIEELFKNKIDEGIKDIENKCKEKNTLVKAQNHKLEALKKSVANGQKEIDKTQQEIQAMRTQLETCEKDKKDLQSNHDMFEKDYQNKKDYLKELEINYENFKNGKNDNVGLLNLNKLIAECTNNKNKSNAEKVNLISQMSFLSDETKSKKLKLNEFKSKLKESEKQFASFQNQIAFVEKELSTLKSESNSQMIDVIQKQISKKESELNILESQQNEILNRYASRVEVQFRDPEPNFNRSKVKGRVIRLFTLENDKYAKAIEQAAGGRMYNVVVDTEVTASLLLSRRCFDYGVTMIPMNKIVSKAIPQEKLKLIEQISNGEAKLALDLIKFDDQYRTAMQFVFGSTFICPTSEIAHKLAFNESIRVKCVNLDGDIFDPTGLITGGASRQGESILKRVVDLSIIQEKISNNKRSILESKKELDEIVKGQKKINEFTNQLNGLKAQANEYDKDKILGKIKEIENDINKTNETIKRNELRIEELNEFEKKYSEELKKLKAEQGEFENIQSTTKKKDVYQKKIQNIKSTITQFEKNIKKIKTDINDLDFKVSQINKDITSSEESLKEQKEAIDSTKNEIEQLTNKTAKLTEEAKKLEAELYEKKKEITKNENELNSLKEQRERLLTTKDGYLSDMKKIETKINKYEKEIKESQEHMQKLEKENKWIQAEVCFFGMKDTDYDFSTLDPKGEYEKLSKLKEDNAVLKRKVNMKVDVMADQYEKEYNDLIKKKEIILKDKQNIQNAIDELDKKRKDALEDIYKQVNVSINSIYSTLLPGTKAKLSQVDPKTLMNGLELKVAFNDHWKKSLSELSGGQVSLLALSLILSLLLYKPAPLYIFDEIDAALDLSHTANLGLMLKEHFPQSQFIVVSLKDGMFNNANVLYKVSYVNGSSRVERITKAAA